MHESRVHHVLSTGHGDIAAWKGTIVTLVNAAKFPPLLTSDGEQARSCMVLALLTVVKTDAVDVDGWFYMCGHQNHDIVLRGSMAAISASQRPCMLSCCRSCLIELFVMSRVLEMVRCGSARWASGPGSSWMDLQWKVGMTSLTLMPRQ
eukprot:1710024-Amphidinium_carterae.1